MRPDSRLAGKPLVTLRDCTEQPMIQPKTNFVHRGQMHPLFFNARLQNRGQLDVASCCAFRCSTSAAQCTASWNFTRGERPSCPSSRRLLPGSLRRPCRPMQFRQHRGRKIELPGSTAGREGLSGRLSGGKTAEQGSRRADRSIARLCYENGEARTGTTRGSGRLRTC